MRVLFLIVGIALLGSALFMARLTVRVRDRGDTAVAFVHVAVLGTAGAMALAGFADPGSGRYFGLALAALLLGDAVGLAVLKRLRRA